jgi:predicted ATP-dependent Lon-type protease
LIEAATNHNVTTAPRLSQLATATAVRKEFVAFASENGEMDYGFCTASNAERKLVKVVSAATGTEKVIPADAICSVLPVGAAPIPLSAHKRITAAGISREDAKQEKEYYTRLYSYAPDYLAEVIRQIEGTAAV